MSQRCVISIALLVSVTISGCAGTRDHLASIWDPLGNVVSRSPADLRKELLEAAETESADGKNNGLAAAFGKFSEAARRKVPIDPFIDDVTVADSDRNESQASDSKITDGTDNDDTNVAVSIADEHEDGRIELASGQDLPDDDAVKHAMDRTESRRLQPVKKISPPRSEPVNIAGRLRGKARSNRPPRSGGFGYRTRSAGNPELTAKLDPVVPSPNVEPFVPSETDQPNDTKVADVPDSVYMPLDQPAKDKPELEDRGLSIPVVPPVPFQIVSDVKPVDAKAPSRIRTAAQIQPEIASSSPARNDLFRGAPVGTGFDEPDFVSPFRVPTPSLAAAPTPSPTPTNLTVPAARPPALAATNQAFPETTKSDERPSGELTVEQLLESLRADSDQPPQRSEPTPPAQSKPAPPLQEMLFGQQLSLSDSDPIADTTISAAQGPAPIVPERAALDITPDELQAFGDTDDLSSVVSADDLSTEDPFLVDDAATLPDPPVAVNVEKAELLPDPDESFANMEEADTTFHGTLVVPWSRPGTPAGEPVVITNYGQDLVSLEHGVSIAPTTRIAADAPASDAAPSDAFEQSSDVEGKATAEPIIIDNPITPVQSDTDDDDEVPAVVVSSATTRRHSMDPSENYNILIMPKDGDLDMRLMPLPVQPVEEQSNVVPPPTKIQLTTTTHPDPTTDRNLVALAFNPVDDAAGQLDDGPIFDKPSFEDAPIVDSGRVRSSLDNVAWQLEPRPGTGSDRQPPWPAWIAIGLCSIAMMYLLRPVAR